MIEPGLYKHFKGGTYEVLATGTSSVDESKVVIYLNSKGDVWVRPLESWVQNVIWPDGLVRSRFVKSD